MCFAFVLGAGSRGVHDNPLPETLVLSSLTPGCRLAVRSSERPGPDVWLVCQNSRFLVLGRQNLEGQVIIKTPQQALEFVRLFTTPDTWYLSRMDQMVEVTAGRRPEKERFVVSEERFAACCVLPTVDTVRSLADGGEFTVRRTVVERDYRVFAIKEIVRERGSVTVSEKTLLNVDGRTLGGFLDPYIM